MNLYICSMYIVWVFFFKFENIRLYILNYELMIIYLFYKFKMVNI